MTEGSFFFSFEVEKLLAWPGNDPPTVELSQCQADAFASVWSLHCIVKWSQINDFYVLSYSGIFK